MSKTFRLFISSTFNDFKLERQVLQTQVFPIIREYAKEQGYTFQPIDLRWGISNEAQLDQKTLELCLNEVRACKRHIAPNFLVMLGDRYGWVPLPYAIEEQELNTLLDLMNEEEKSLINEWYKLDLNSIPASYILKERVDKYKDYDTWQKLEISIRNILISTVTQSNLNPKEQKKYFQSATEAEVQEGVLKFKDITPFQEKVLQKKDDTEHIFGFFRDIEKSSKKSDIFIENENDYTLAQEFKHELKKQLLDENILETKIVEIEESKLEESYLIEFKKQIIKFLKKKINVQVAQEKIENFSSLEIELQEQSFYAHKKREHFYSREDLRASVSNYIQNANKEALVIYGKSGQGKSALMSQVIHEAQGSSQSQVIYRFVGATAHSSNSIEVLSSIFEELGIDISSTSKEDNLEEFSYRVYDAWSLIKEKTTIFIDAVDQFQNSDQFLWLPKKLPDNVKIICSALKDENYTQDSYYFENIQNKTQNLIEIPKFEKPLALLKNILKEYNRTLDAFQENYFLEQYRKVQTPLYVILAAEEIKNWKSGDTTQTLESSQRELISEYISNLSDIHHHDKEFVTAVLFFIYTSKDGLSEAEILELLAQNENFIKRLAPETWHKNLNKEIPLVHWSRLYTELKPFLNFKIQNGEELMYFFHREFEDVISTNKDIFYGYKAILKSTIQLITKYQDQAYKTNRWGYLFFIVACSVSERYDDKDAISLTSRKGLIEIGRMLLDITNTQWLGQYLLNNSYNIDIYEQQQKNTFALIAAQHLSNLSFSLWAQKDPLLFSTFCVITGNKLATLYSSNNQVDLSKELYEAIGEIQNFINSVFEEEMETDLYQKFTENMTRDNIEEYTYKYVKYIVDSDLNTNFAKIYKFHKEWIDDIYNPLYMISGTSQSELARSRNFMIEGQFKETQNLLYDAEDKIARFYSAHPQYKEFSTLNETSNIEQEYVIRSLRAIYFEIIVSLAGAHLANNEEEAGKKWLDAFLNDIETSYKNDKKHFAPVYVKYLASYSGYIDKDKQQAIKSINLSFEIASNEYAVNPYSWAEIYLASLSAMVVMHNFNYEEKKGLKYALLAHDVAKNLYDKNNDRFKLMYINSLMTLSLSHIYSNNNSKAKETANMILGLSSNKHHIKQVNEILKLAKPSYKKIILILTILSSLIFIAYYFLGSSTTEEITHTQTSSKNTNVPLNKKESVDQEIKLKSEAYTIEIEKIGYINTKVNIIDMDFSKNINLKKRETSTKKKAITHYPLYIQTDKGAKVQITNIRQKYYSGIKLKAGMYKIKVTKAGYTTKYSTVYMTNSSKYVKLYLKKKVFKKSEQKKVLKKETITKQKVQVKKIQPVPDNASINFDGTWSCDTGYELIGSECI